MSVDNKWWLNGLKTGASVSYRADDIITAWAQHVMSEAAVASGAPMHITSCEGRFEGDLSDFEQLLTDMGGKLIVKHADYDPEVTVGSTGTVLYTWDDAIARISIQTDKWIDAKFMSTDSAVGEQFAEKTRNILKKRGRQRAVYVLIKSQDGVSLSSLGTHGMLLARDNYEPDVLRGFDHILKDMQSPNPCGRVILFDGPPGTGKTHLVKALIQEVPNSTFVLLPLNVMTQLTRPDMIQSLLDSRRSSTGPLVLILEDADEALAPRKFDNITSVSELLNLGDGILGGALDIRIVATTNTPKAEIDEAMLRPGRLCRRVGVGTLSHDTVAKIFKRLKYDGEVNKDIEYTLADVYKTARGVTDSDTNDDGEQKVVEKKTKRAAGFAIP